MRQVEPAAAAAHAAKRSSADGCAKRRANSSVLFQYELFAETDCCTSMCALRAQRLAGFCSCASFALLLLPDPQQEVLVSAAQDLQSCCRRCTEIAVRTDLRWLSALPRMQAILLHPCPYCHAGTPCNTGVSSPAAAQVNCSSSMQQDYVNATQGLSLHLTLGACSSVETARIVACTFSSLA